MTTDTPSSRDEEIPTPRCEKAKVGASWIIASHSAGDFIPCELGEELERDLIRLSAEREKERDTIDMMTGQLQQSRATLAERDNQLAEAKWEQKVLKEMVFNRSEELDKLETDVQAICRKSINAQREREVRELTAQLLAAQTVNATFQNWIERVGFFFAGTDHHHIAEKALEVLRTAPDPTLLDEVKREKEEMAEKLKLAENGLFNCRTIADGCQQYDGRFDRIITEADHALASLRQSTRETEKKV